MKEAGKAVNHGDGNPIHEQDGLLVQLTQGYGRFRCINVDNDYTDDTADCRCHQSHIQKNSEQSNLEGHHH